MQREDLKLVEQSKEQVKMRKGKPGRKTWRGRRSH
jgi:hypothetical protein